ncbi:MAG: hypothetical protein ACLT1R_00760 [Lachnospiraceae bacterium]|nr:MAG: hypothetical protein BHV88_04965 [Clostridiales bacterium 41_12_two_minus]
MLIPVVISSIPIKIVWAVDCGVTIVKNSERIEKNIKSIPILTKRSRQVSQISFSEGSGEDVSCTFFLVEILRFATDFKRKRSVHSKKDAKKGRYAHKRKTKRIFVGSASKADATKPDKNSGLGS